METRPLRTLIIEDDAICAQLLKEMLAVDGAGEVPFVVDLASSLSQALVQLSKNSFDIALLDLRLPDAQGTDTCAAISSIAPSLAIVVVSGSSEQEGNSTECMEKGAQDYLVKGVFDRKHLLHSLRYAYQRKKIETEFKAAQQALLEANRALVEKVHDLDRLNAVMMGREEKILEMKEEIKRLNEQLAKAWRLAS